MLQRLLAVVSEAGRLVEWEEALEKAGFSALVFFQPELAIKNIETFNPTVMFFALAHCDPQWFPFIERTALLHTDVSVGVGLGPQAKKHEALLKSFGLSFAFDLSDSPANNVAQLNYRSTIS